MRCDLSLHNWNPLNQSVITTIHHRFFITTQYCVGGYYNNLRRRTDVVRWDCRNVYCYKYNFLHTYSYFLSLTSTRVIYCKFLLKEQLQNALLLRCLIQKQKAQRKEGFWWWWFAYWNLLSKCNLILSTYLPHFKQGVWYFTIGFKNQSHFFYAGNLFII